MTALPRARTYRAKVTITRKGREVPEISYAIYDTSTGGIVFTDNTGAKSFYGLSFWRHLYDDLNIANTHGQHRRWSAGHKPLKPLWGNIHHQSKGPWS